MFSLDTVAAKEIDLIYLVGLKFYYDLCKILSNIVSYVLRK